ncbi:hypothetical protein [Paenibacillus sp. SN-8-1]|uniref:hypothetical protein n=1 Tax=Paenibacillus sp. SN-8-1 TaxID=3435409 RepID=UPI003D9A6BED
MRKTVAALLVAALGLNTYQVHTSNAQSVPDLQIAAKISDPLGTNIYPNKSLSEKKQMMEFLGNFPEEVQHFDIKSYKDDELVRIAATNTTKYGIGPLKKLMKSIVVRPLTDQDGKTYDWPYYKIPKKDTEQYIQSLFGVTPKKVSKSYYENGAYYFPSWEAGGGNEDSPQIERMYAFGKGYYYVELTRYYIEAVNYDPKLWQSFGDFEHMPMEKWSKAIKDRIYVEKEGSWHAILKENVINGKKTWRLVEYNKGTKLTKTQITKYISKL